MIWFIFIFGDFKMYSIVLDALRAQLYIHDIQDVSDATGISKGQLYCFRRKSIGAPSADIVDKLLAHLFPNHALILQDVRQSPPVQNVAA